MSLPHDSRFDDRQLERYVLGLLSEGDRERLDEASIVDDEVALRLRVVEHDLADSYVRGLLTGDTLSRFESHYLASPLRRENVRLAEKLASAIARITPVEPAPLPQPVKSEPRLARGLAAVAALVLAASAPLLIELISARLLDRAPAARVRRDRPARELMPQRGDATFAHALLAEQDATILCAQTSAFAPIRRHRHSGGGRSGRVRAAARLVVLSAVSGWPAETRRWTRLCGAASGFSRGHPPVHLRFLLSFPRAC